MTREHETTWRWQVPEQFNIGVACTDAHAGTAAAQRVAMIVEDDADGTTSATFAQLADATARFADLLRRLGVDVGERVLIRLPNSLAYPTAFLGAMKRGAIAVPTSTLLVAEEVRYLAQDSGAAVLVTHKAMWPDLAPALRDAAGLRHVILAGAGPVPAAGDGPALHDLEASLAAADGSVPPHPTRAEDPAYLVYTSGTTGHPKGVLHAHRAMIGRSPAATHWFDFRPGDRIMHSGKFNWTYVLGSGLMDPLYNGLTVIVHEGRNDATLWPRLIAKHGCTVFIGVPTIYRQIIQKTEYAKQDVPTLRHCMSAGEHLSDEMLAAWRDRFGMDVYEAIGMSEISYYISQNKFHPIRPGSAGFPQPGHDVRLLDADHDEVPAGEEGMICIRDDDPGLFLRYWNLPEETAKHRHGGWFHTGDYARRDGDGYLWFVGRKDDIINTFGYRVSPHEVERVMKTHPDVADCVAIGQDLGKDKTLVAACVVLRPGGRATEADLLAFGEQHLAGYKRPKIVHLMDDYPRTKNGKVIRSQLKRQVEGGRPGEAA
ncbi:MAG: acyl-CoA synthetase [Gammaproteobacteria bacterium]|jgi:acyl-coenzyme A synthetase/AMP-(fatty) acid ligase|nr:acyl-CoA synthetase [Gammaproteobacteria bacterium]